ncbi:MAG: hypothetical protein M1548_04375 [Actinobacteria bacterium]|nr:hypothetical protein [Actinomycetota bacterium]
MKIDSASTVIWMGVVILAISTIFAAALALSTSVIGALMGGTAFLAVIDLIIARTWGRRAKRQIRS